MEIIFIIHMRLGLTRKLSLLYNIISVRHGKTSGYMSIFSNE